MLAHDLRDSGLAGDLAAIVHVHSADAFEAEFVTASGETTAPLTLSVTDIRPVSDNDLQAGPSDDTPVCCPTTA